MAYNKIMLMDIYEIIRRWHNNQKISHIAELTGYVRKSVRKYIECAKAKGIILEFPLPPKEDVLSLMQDVLTTTQHPAKAQTTLEPYLSEVKALVNDKQMPLKSKIAFEVLCEKHQPEGKVSYSSFKRFVQTNSIIILPDQSTCRIEVAPAKEVQIDYGRMGLITDPLTGQRRTIYGFIGSLSYSRHKYVEFVFKQDQQGFVGSNVRMMEYFGGVVERLVIDNLKNGVIKPDLYDPRFNRAFREMAEHYGCFIDPCRVGQPKDKGKVERDVPTIRQQFRKFLAIYPGMDLGQANRLITDWVINKYGQKEHGTTGLKPYPTFLDEKKPRLKPLPPEPFVIAQWKEAKVHADHHVQFKKKFYSVPHPYVGKTVWVKGTDKLIQIFYEDQLIKQHVVDAKCRHTDWADFPQNVRAALDEGVPLKLQQKAQTIGPWFHQLVRNTLEPHAFINLRKAQGLLNLVDKWDHTLVEQAAAYTLTHNISVTPKNFKRTLEMLKDEQ